MPINSSYFLLFLAVTVLFYYLVPQKWRYLILLGASIFFYLAYSVPAAAYLLLTVASTYLFARLLQRLHSKEKSALGQEGVDRKQCKRRFKGKKRRLLTLALLLNFAALALFKYVNVWLQDLNGLLALFGLGFSFRPLELLLPLGISFYIFQTSGYLIDVYRGKVRPETNFLKYSLFVCYFPQIIQGPINRFDKLQPQLIGGSPFRGENLKAGIQLMLFGLLKKVLIADVLAGVVGELYGNFLSYPGAFSLLAAVLYCIQLYCDFSGGVDVVRGASQLFGITMAENFRRPYLAHSLDEFWRRWHISLGDWMKDYLFYPLALSGPMARLGKGLRRWLPKQLGKLVVPSLCTLIVFTAVGLWQGPGWQNIAYGLYNGGLMSLAMLLQNPTRSLSEKLHIRRESGWYRGFCVLRTFFLVVIGRYFSRADGLLHALKMLWRSLRYFADGLSLSAFSALGLSLGQWIGVAVACLLLLTVSILRERGADLTARLDRKHWSLQFVALLIPILILLLLVYLNSDYTAIGFVYENV